MIVAAARAAWAGALAPLTALLGSVTAALASIVSAGPPAADGDAAGDEAVAEAWRRWQRGVELVEEARSVLVAECAWRQVALAALVPERCSVGGDGAGGAPPHSERDRDYALALVSSWVTGPGPIVSTRFPPLLAERGGGAGTARLPTLLEAAEALLC